MPRGLIWVTDLQTSRPLPLTIGVISDTHIYPNGARQLPPGVLALFQRAEIDLILHLGDINHRGVLDDLEQIAPVLAVQGNNDDADLVGLLPLAHTFSAGPYTIGMVHGHGGRSAREVALTTFAGTVDIACYGHSHIPKLEEVSGTLLLNPGSATDRRWHPHFGVAIIRIDDNGIDPQLILYSDPRHLAGMEFDWTASNDRRPGT